MTTPKDEAPTLAGDEASSEKPSSTKENHMDIMTLTPGNGQPAKMSSREIAELTSKQHQHVKRDIEAMLAELKEDVSSFGRIYLDSMNRQQTEYLLDRELTETLLTGYSAVLRRKVIARWRELEGNADNPMLALGNPATLRLVLLGYTEKVIELESKVEELSPKAAALDQISASTGSVTVTQAAKILGVKRAFLTDFMHTHGWIYRQNASWVAYDRYEKNGYLQYKEARYTDEKTGQECISPYCHIKPKGLAKLAELLQHEKQAA